MIRVLIADAYTILRHGLRLILEEDPLITVVGEAARASELMAQIDSKMPHVVVMDLGLSNNNGIETIRHIRTTSPHTQVVVLTTCAQGEVMLAACRAGAKGYLSKNVSGVEVIQAIHQVASGQAALPPQLTTQLLNELATELDKPSLNSLTRREVEVLQCLVHGACNKEIADHLIISENTVKTHIRRILAKLNLRNRTEAATFAMQTNLTPPLL